jgi:hypothetical protein
MEPQREMLMALGVDGMSSDEEQRVPSGVQYRILTPRWRSSTVTYWLRMFDKVHLYHRLEHGTNDMRGCLPRTRVPTSIESESRRFVPGLPLNAYKESWLHEQLDVPNLVHPTPSVILRHDEVLSMYVLPSHRAYSS